jgi:hypothetical protein
MRMTMTYFSHSTYATTHLKALRVIYSINKGLEKIGKTRFGILYWASYALLRCLAPISELIETGVINVEGSDKGRCIFPRNHNRKTYRDNSRTRQSWRGLSKCALSRSSSWNSNSLAPFLNRSPEPSSVLKGWRLPFVTFVWKARAPRLAIGKFGSVQVRGVFFRTPNSNFGSGSEIS